MKNCYILRSASGAGKSTLAEELVRNNKSSVICSADDYFIDQDGNYIWDETKIHSAHKWCQSLFQENLKTETEIIVVSNTNTRNSDVELYRNLALEYGYLVFVLVVENRHNGNDIHNVPNETKERMKNQLIKSIKL